MTEGEMVGWHHQLNDMSLSKLRETVKDREAWHASMHPWGHKESDKTLQLSMHDNSNIERPFMYVLNVFMSSL